MDIYKPNENQEYYGYIYLILDQKHNKVYVGQKKEKVEKSCNYFGSGFFIMRILKSRGTYFLKKIILGVCDNREEISECEKECISFFDSTNIKYGHNLTIGGIGGSITKGKKFRDVYGEEKAKQKSERISKALTGKKHTKETKEKLSKLHIGKKHTEKTKKKRSDSLKNKPWSEKRREANKQGIINFKKTWYNRTEDDKNKSLAKFKETLKNNPEVKKKSTEKTKKTLKNNPEIRENQIKKYKENVKEKNVVKERCIELIKNNNLQVNLISSYLGSKHWKEFEEYLLSLIKESEGIV